MNNSNFAQMKKNLLAYYNEYFVFNSEDQTSSNNLILQSTLDSFNDLLQYNNTVSSGAILNDFKDQYGDMQLHDKSVKKLLKWLNDIDIMFTFEQDIIISSGCNWYCDKQAFLYYACEEYHEQLDHWLQGEKLTDRQVNIIENELSSCISTNQEYLYIHRIDFEFKLPKAAILREYTEYVRSNR